MIQELIVGLLFAGALAFLVRFIYRSWKSDRACAKGCGCDVAVPKHLRKGEGKREVPQ